MYRCLVGARMSCEAVDTHQLASDQRQRLSELHDHLVRAGRQAASRLSHRDRARVDVEVLAQRPAPTAGLAEVEEGLLAAADSLADLRARSSAGDIADRICVELLHAAAALPTDAPG
jgi:hypothetical protein